MFVRYSYDTSLLACLILPIGFLWVSVLNSCIIFSAPTDCHHEHLVAFSWPLLRIHAPATFVHPARHHAEDFSRGLPVRAAVRGEWQETRRMTESAALLVDDVLPHEPIR
jgi:hypothetical protein